MNVFFFVHVFDASLNQWREFDMAGWADSTAGQQELEPTEPKIPPAKAFLDTGRYKKDS